MFGVFSRLNHQVRDDLVQSQYFWHCFLMPGLVVTLVAAICHPDSASGESTPASQQEGPRIDSM